MITFIFLFVFISCKKNTNKSNIYKELKEACDSVSNMELKGLEVYQNSTDLFEQYKEEKIKLILKVFDGSDYSYETNKLKEITGIDNLKLECIIKNENLYKPEESDNSEIENQTVLNKKKNDEEKSPLIKKELPEITIKNSFDKEYKNDETSISLNTKKKKHPLLQEYKQ